jgi:hypothetical protein
MHSLNYAVMGNQVANERARRPMVRAVKAPRPERPPSAPIRARAAYAVGRMARRLDRETARRAVA